MFAPKEELEKDHSMILVMGVTGSGKSYFINRLAAGTAVEGHNLKSGMWFVRAERPSSLPD
jgi:predicted GTPase